MNPPQRPRQWQPRFTVASLFLIVLVCAMTATGARYLAEANRQEGRRVLVIGVLIIPMLTVIALSSFLRVRRWWQASPPRSSASRHQPPRSS